jgi:putative hemolysin
MVDVRFALEIALIGFLILMSGLFAGSQIAVISARRSRIQALAQAGRRRARALLRLKADPDRFLATVQIGVTAVGTLAATLGGVFAIKRIEPMFASVPQAWTRQLAEALAVVTVVVTISFLSLVVGELIPKSLAIRHADTIGLWVAFPIEWLARTFRPVVSGLTAASGMVFRLFGQSSRAASPFHTVEDIRALLDEADEQGVLDGQVVKGAVGFQDLDARHLMTPRSRVVGIPRDASVETALRIARESGFSRFPVHAADLDDIDGIVYARDLFEAPLRARERGLAAFVRPALMIPVTKRAREILADMRHAQRHMAVVVDEHGAVIGIVTLEDVFEAIVGEIKDERDEPGSDVRLVKEDLFDVDGSVPLRQLNTRHGLFLPESPDYVTVAGLFLHRLGSVPVIGQSVEVEPYRVIVTEMAGRRIARVRIELVPAQVEA